MLRFRDFGVFVFDLGCFVFEFWVLRFRDLGASFSILGASFSSFGCFVFEIWVLRASVFVFECFVFETTLGKLTYSRHFQRVVIIATKSEKVLIHFKSDLFVAVAIFTV